VRKIVLIFVFLLFIPAYFYLIKYSEGWTNRSIAGSIADGQPHQELVTRSYTVERVIDGNTLKLTNGEEVQLIGIKAPEDDKMGQEATEFVKNLGLEGKEVRLELDVQEKDKYGRLLAYVLIDLKPGPMLELPPGTCGTSNGTSNWCLWGDEDITQILLNARIIGAGYATPMTIPPNVKYADLFKKLYEAREQKRGLWKGKVAKGGFKHIGSFDNVKSETGEHCSGYSVSLWSMGDSIIGLLDYHAGLCGDPPCSVVIGEIDKNNITFTTTQPIYDIDYKYKGEIEQNKLIGKINDTMITMKSYDYAVSHDSLENWCSFWSTVPRCVGVKEFCKQTKDYDDGTIKVPIGE